MLIKKDWTLIQILKRTWKFDLLIIFVCLVVFSVYNYWISNHIQLPALLSTVLGTAIAFFIGFNNNQAYGRWWEARIIWGAIVNDSRSWSRSLLSYIDVEQERAYGEEQLQVLQRRMIHRHLAFLYALKYSLRKISDTTYNRYLNPVDFEKVKDRSNIPNAILNLQSEDLERLSRLGCIDGFRFIELNQLLVKFCDGMGRCERIKNTVFPTSYIYFTQLFIWFFIVVNTIVLTDMIGIWAVPIGWLIGFIFFAAHTNGTTIMNPFENTAFDTPMSSIVRTIEINTLEEMEADADDIPKPIQPINGEYML